MAFLGDGAGLWGVLELAVAALCLLSVIGFLGQNWWLFDLASHFRGQYFFLLTVLALALWLGRRDFFFGSAGLFALINLALVAPLYIRQPAVSAQGARTYRLMLANILQQNREYAKICELIQAEKPDFIVLVETDRSWLEALQGIETEYPYTQSLTREDNYGVALYSRLPFQGAEIQYFGRAETPSVIATYRLEGHRLTLLGAHPPPPKGPVNSALRNDQLSGLASFCRAQSGEVVLCGDLNMSPWSPYFRRLLRQSGLKDSARGFGLQPTWPTNNPLLRVPIDHCLVSKGIQVRARSVGPSIGSDHFPVILDFTVTGGNSG